MSDSTTDRPEPLSPDRVAVLRRRLGMDPRTIKGLCDSHEALLGALAGPNDPPDDEAMLNVLCECGHRAGIHGHDRGIPGSRCYERLTDERLCPCERFKSTGVLAGPNDTEENPDG